MADFLFIMAGKFLSEAKMNEYLKWDTFKNRSGKLMVYIGKGTELVAGILFLFGLFTRLAALLILGRHVLYHFFTWQRNNSGMKINIHFLFVLLALVFFFTGAGRIKR